MTMASTEKLAKNKKKGVVNKILVSHQSVFLCIAIGAFLIANTSFLIGEQLKFYQSAGLSFIVALGIAFFSEFSVVFVAAFGMATKIWFRRFVSYGLVLCLLIFNYYHPYTHLIQNYLGFMSPSLGGVDPILLNKLQVLIMIWNLLLGSYAGYLLRNLIRSELVTPK